MLFEIIEDIAYEVAGVWQDAKSDWKFAKRQMDTMQKVSLRKEDD